MFGTNLNKGRRGTVVTPKINQQVVAVSQPAEEVDEDLEAGRQRARRMGRTESGEDSAVIRGNLRKQNKIHPEESTPAESGPAASVPAAATPSVFSENAINNMGTTSTALLAISNGLMQMGVSYPDNSPQSNILTFTAVGVFCLGAAAAISQQHMMAVNRGADIYGGDYQFFSDNASLFSSGAALITGVTLAATKGDKGQTGNIIAGAVYGAANVLATNLVQSISSFNAQKIQEVIVANASANALTDEVNATFATKEFLTELQQTLTLKKTKEEELKILKEANDGMSALLHDDKMKVVEIESSIAQKASKVHDWDEDVDISESEEIKKSQEAIKKIADEKQAAAQAPAAKSPKSAWSFSLHDDKDLSYQSNMVAGLGMTKVMLQSAVLLGQTYSMGLDSNTQFSNKIMFGTAAASVLAQLVEVAQMREIANKSAGTENQKAEHDSLMPFLPTAIAATSLIVTGVAGGETRPSPAFTAMGSAVVDYVAGMAKTYYGNIIQDKTESQIISAAKAGVVKENLGIDEMRKQEVARGKEIEKENNIVNVYSSALKRQEEKLDEFLKPVKGRTLDELIAHDERSSNSESPELPELELPDEESSLDFESSEDEKSDIDISSDSDPEMVGVLRVLRNNFIPDGATTGYVPKIVESRSPDSVTKGRGDRS